jgi:UPF0042 nucleotide-binding protein
MIEKTTKEILKKELVIITGMSGAGKSETMDFFEDRGYFCIDNFPINLFQYFNEIFLSDGKRDKIAVVIDIRDKEFVKEFIKQLKFIQDQKIKYTVIYLDASTNVLLSRYELSRRKHPLNMYETLIKNIEEERKLIKDFKLKASIIIDTSKTTAKQFHEILEREFEGNTTKLSINVTSFGYKYGIPLDAHLMFDLRFLPNPYYIEELRSKTGNHKDVYNYVINLDESKEFYKKLYDMLVYLIPKYEVDGKAHLRIAIGCSGGQHRSVSFVNKLVEDLNKKFDYKITKFHREVGAKKEI